MRRTSVYPLIEVNMLRLKKNKIKKDEAKAKCS